ncbi:MAG: PAS domain S-box protein [Phycisphaerales bacterium]|nr:PAS domain S-box protein [Phycisphaerales bacterium]
MKARCPSTKLPIAGQSGDDVAPVLLENAGLYRSLLDNTPMGISIINSQYEVLVTNAEQARRCGKRDSEIVGERCHRAFQGEGSPCEHCPGTTAMRTGLPAEVEIQVLGDDDSMHDLLVQAYPTFGRDGAVSGFIEIVEDVTAEKRSARALRSANERFRAIYETAPLGYQSLDENGKICDVNPAWLRTLGYVREEVVGCPFIDFLTAESATHFSECFPSVRECGEAHGVELEMVGKDGRRVTVELDCCGRRSGDDDPAYIMCVFRDVTERKRAAEALRASSAGLAALADEQKFLLENMRDYVYRHDEHGVFYYLSPAVEQVTGYTVEEWKSHYTTYLTDNPINDRVVEYTERTLRTGEINPPYLVEIFHKLGHRVMLEVSERPYHSDGRPAGIVGVARDVSERERAESEKQQLEAQLRQAQKMEAIGQLAGGVAHDFNNILTAILGNTEIAMDGLLKKLAPDDGLLQNLQEVGRAADRAASLTRQLLAFSRRQTAQPEVLQLNKSLREMEPMLRRLLAEDIEFVIKPSPDLANVCADAGQIAQVIMNLVVNARDAMPTGGKLTLETANVELDEDFCRTDVELEPGAYVTLAVSDTGCGMDAATQERIFEPFFTTKEVGKGTGLGLAMIYGIVKQAGGHVTVHSKLKKGTCFRIYLPAVTADTQQPTAPKVEQRAPSGSETILVCEDDEAVRELAVQVLRDVGYHVMPACDGTTALNIVRACSERIHLLVTDIIMPDLNGRGLAETLLSSRPDLKVLYISGYTHDVIAHRGIVEEGIDFLQKPFSREKLLQRVRAALDGVPAAVQS